MKRILCLFLAIVISAVASAQEARIRTQTITIKMENKLQRVEITWPQISGLANLDAQDRINDNLFMLFVGGESIDENWASNILHGETGVNRIGDESIAGASTVIEIPDFDPDSPVIMQLDWQTKPRIILNGDGLLSVGCATYVFTGGAHGMSFWRYRLFDLNTGEAYSLDDLFIDGYEAQLDALVDGRVPREELFTPNEPVKMADGAEWYTSEEGFVAQFHLYAIGPRAAGFLEALIPFEDLEELMKPDSPLRKLR